MFALGMVLGGFLAGEVFANPEPTQLSAAAVRSLNALGVPVQPGMVPTVLQQVTNFKILGMLSLSSLLVGFGTRYGGCTSGHYCVGCAARP